MLPPPGIEPGTRESHPSLEAPAMSRSNRLSYQNHIIKMVIYPTHERDDDDDGVVDFEHKDDDFEDVIQGVD